MSPPPPRSSREAIAVQAGVLRAADGLPQRFPRMPEGRDQIREIDSTIADVPGLEGRHLLEDYLDGAPAGGRAARWAGVARTQVALACTNGHAPAPTHWAQAGTGRCVRTSL